MCSLSSDEIWGCRHRGGSLWLEQVTGREPSALEGPPLPGRVGGAVA